ncbi:MAG: class I SAM-dependent DNA methyltransferase [Phycisphaerales bacterium]|nr:class I SAM-dependent DNA methyltransferase [Phycisphaerales bacterium]
MDADRKKQLADFVTYAKTLKGDEKGEAQVFLDRLFRAFSRDGYKEAGATLEHRVRRDTGTGFADLVWKPVVLIEMKKRGEDLSRHLLQAFHYWEELVPGRPRYVVLCNFDEFRIYDFDQDIHQPQDTITLDELPDRYGPLNFLWPTNEPVQFKINREKATRQAADLLAKVYRTLLQRKAASPAHCQRFILQTLVCLFAEDIELLPKYFFTQLLKECVDPPKAFDLLDGLFRAMNAHGGAPGGRFKPVPFFNGGLFSQSAAIELDPANELVFLKRAAEDYNWAFVSPDIFGTIFQHSLLEGERHAMGAHYTSQQDIMKIVGPTIVQPFTTAIEQTNSLKELAAVRARLTSLRVLDPACGSGNFLYVAYREMRRLEASIILKQSELSKRQITGQGAFAEVSPRQFFGLDILPFAVELAKVTLSIAPKLASDELHTTEPALPLANLDSNILCKDALIESGGTSLTGGTGVPPVRTPWPVADVIIGNPPFLGAKRLKPERGPDYVNAVRKLYPEVPGMADYCVYWFRRSHDHLPAATPADPFAGRAGLVGTQNIRNNQSRVGGLDHIVKSGVIVEAVENLPWSGEANVHVSIANWVKTGSDGARVPPAVSRVASESQPDGLKARSRGSPRGGGGTPGKRAAHIPDPEGVVDAASPVNEPALLIPSPRRLWSKVDPKLALFDQDNPAPNPKVVTTGKRGRVRQDKSYEMAVREAVLINSALSDTVDASAARTLLCNTEPQRVFQGVTPGHEGFLLTPQERRSLLAEDPGSRRVTFPYLIGRELLSGDGSPSRFIIDFDAKDVNKASAFTGAFSRIQKLVLPKRKSEAAKDQKRYGQVRSHHKKFLEYWWQPAWGRSDMLAAIEKLPRRYLVCSRVTKRPIFVFVCKSVRPGDALQTFLFADDLSFSVLQSGAHWQWFIAKCSKLTERFRYTPESVFDTFPWPQSPTKKQIRTVAAAGREVRRIRAETLPTIKGGLRALYRTLELPGKNPLKDAHAALDAAVLDAYGFSPKKDLLKQLLDLNLAVAMAIDKGDPVTAPGVPPSYGDPAEGGLITDDCIKP